ncbi:MAG TPA: AAA family ATPase [Acidimicrobiales bacterium]|nr:AAA family ATPase [Acidimicrobiales bacterium]
MTDDEREAFARQLVAACRTKGLGAIAITDHHDFAMYPFVSDAAAAEVDPDGEPYPEHQRLVVFPGLELTLGVPCQAILILDAAMPLDRLSLVLEALAIDAVDPTEARLPKVTRIDHVESFSALHEALDARLWLRGRYIVLPNVTDGGHGGMMRRGMQAKYKTMPCVGGYLDGTVENKVGAGNRRIFAGLDANWGNKKIALFQTSDSRHKDFDDLGRHSTWAKWAEPTAEAIRQACLAQESRISQVTPAIPTVFISRLVVSNSRFLGSIDLHLNRQYNAFIGGRGTGKSTLLDYLRWGLCDEPASAAADDEVANPAARRERLIEDTLTVFDATVEVHFTINQIQHVARRHAKTGELQLRVGEGEFGRTREADVRSVLPIHAYSQKQLSSVSVRIDELTRFITAPISSKLDGIDQRSSELSGQLRENFATLRRAADLDAAIANSTILERSLSEQAESLRKSLRGLTEADQQLLASKSAYDDATDLADQWGRSSMRSLESLTDLKARLESDREGVGEVPASPEALEDAIRALGSAYQSGLDAALAHLDRAISALTSQLSNGSPYRQRRMALDGLVSEFEAQYAKVKARSTDHEAKLASLADVEQRRKAAAELLRAQQQERRQLGDVRSVHAQLRSSLSGLRSERSSVIEAQCAQVTRLSDGLLRASLQRAHGMSAIESRLRGLISGTGLRSAKIDAMMGSLRSESDPGATWEAVLNELELLIDADDDTTLTSEQTPTMSRLGLAVPDQRRVASKLTPEAWLDLLLTPILDEPTFEYQSVPGDYIPFAVASAGQQATALLRVLLAQSGMPLIIDQPEEDLDSQVIQDVVTRLWIAKGNRQIIFASHNANLVVNGDAELVAVCDYRAAGDQSGGRIKAEGAIDVAEVRDEITHVMEGGEKAFRLRKEKYGF